MTRKEILAELQQWQTTQKALDAQLDKLYDLLGCEPDSPLLEVIYRLAEAHTDAIARIIGDDTKAMDWWAIECRFGDNPMQAAVHGKKMRLISNLKQLAALIAA